MKEEDYSKAIEVFSGSPWEAEIIKGLLESNDIRCVIKDGIMGTLAPRTNTKQPPHLSGAGPRKITTDAVEPFANILQ